MLAGSERLLDSLTINMQKDPSFMLSAVRVLNMSSTTRDNISSVIGQSCNKVKNLVFHSANKSCEVLIEDIQNTLGQQEVVRWFQFLSMFRK